MDSNNDSNSDSNRMDELEQDKWTNKSYFILYKNDVPIGYSETMQEAEMICTIRSDYQWDRRKTKKQLPLMTIND